MADTICKLINQLLGRVEIEPAASGVDNTVPVSRLYGLYRGVVIDSVDPDMRLRLKVLVRGVLEGTPLWATPCVPVGSSVQPEVGSGVWIMFEAGDPAYPVWIGTFPDKHAWQ